MGFKLAEVIESAQDDHQSQTCVVCEAKSNLGSTFMWLLSISVNLKPSVSTVNTVSDCLSETGRVGRGWGLVGRAAGGQVQG